jgi:hypothetical protein
MARDEFDFSDLAYEDDFSDLAVDTGQLAEDTLERTGLDVFDDIFGGGLSQATRDNLSDPNYDPASYNRPSAAEESAARADRYNRAREEVLGGKPMEYEKLDVSDQAILGAGQGTLDLIRTGAGIADALRVPGARRVGEIAGEGAQNLGDLAEGGGATGAGDLSQALSRGATSIVPSFVAGYLGGFPAGIVAAGAQSFGSVFEDAQDGYLRQGIDPESARNKAYLPAILSGLITAGVTRLFGADAIDAFRNKMTAKGVSDLVRQPLLEILKGAGKEGAEEASDQVGQAVVERWTYNPEKRIEDIVIEVMTAGGLGAILGGMAEGVNVGLQLVSKADQGRIERGEDPLGRTPEYDPTRGNVVDETGRITKPVPQEETFEDLAEEVPANTNLEPIGNELVDKPSRLRRGERGVKGAAVKIVESMGVSNDTAREFIDKWMAGSPQWGSLEEMRSTLLQAFEGAGLEPETGGSLYREDAESYVNSGMSMEDAADMAARAREANRKTLAEVRARNKARLEAELSPQVRAEMQVQEPSEAQKEAGNYKKGHVKVDGMDITIENVQGSMRRGTDKDGTPWEVQMPADYGYVKGTKGKDGDHVDIYLGPNKNDVTSTVAVVDQIRDDGTFDEHKVLYGFPDGEAAIAAYDAAFSDGKGPQRRGAVTFMTREDFKEWLESGNTKKPLAYKKSSAPAASPQQTIEALRRAESEGRMPDGRPIDRRERVDWLMDESRHLRTEDRDKGWERIQEASKLSRQISADERAKVPDDAAMVRIDGTNFSTIIHPSVQPGYEGQWQATEIDENGQPLGHSVHPTMQKALKDRLDHYKQKVTDVRFKRKGGVANEGTQEGLQEQVVQGVQVAPDEPAVAPAQPEAAVPSRSLIDEVKSIEAPNVGWTRGGDYVTSLMENRSNEEVIDFLRWSQSNDASEFTKRFGGANASAVLRARGVPVDDIKWQADNVRPTAPTTPERTVDEEFELNQIEAKDQVSSDEMRRAETLRTKSARKQKQSFDDIIDYIENAVGKIRSAKGARKGTEGYYGEYYKAALKYGSVRSLFSRTKGQYPDAIVDTLRRDRRMPEDATVDDLWELLERAGARRAAQQSGEDSPETIREKQMIDFSEDAYAKDKKTDEAIQVGSLVTGDTLKINGQEFEITDMLYNADTDTIEEVELSDGKKYGVQRLGGNEVIYADKGSVKREEAEWAPTNETLSTTEDAEGQQVLDAGTGGTLKEIPGQMDAAKQAQMRAEQSTPLQADDIKIQKDMFGAQDPSAADIPLFNQGDEQLSIGDQNGTPKQMRQARGTPSIESMLESSNLPANTKLVWREWLKMPVMQNLDWTPLRLELWDYLQRGIQGARLGRLIMLSQNAKAETFPHEIAHVLFDAMPGFDREAIESWRVSELKKKGVTDQRFLKGDMTSADYREIYPDLEESLGRDGARELYRYINASEFYAFFVSEKFAQDAFKNRNDRPNFWNKVRDIFQAAVDALRRVIGLNPTQEQIYRDTLSGKYQPDWETIDAFEEQNSFSFTAGDAQNAAALAKGPDEKAIEGSHQLAQAFNIVEFLNKHGAPKATAMAQKALRFFDYVGIRAAGENLNGKPESYQQLKKRITDPFQRNWLARLAAVHISNMDGHLKQVIADGNEAFAKLGGMAFLKKLARNDALRISKDNAKLLDEAAGAMLEAAHKRSLKVLKEEAKSDREIAELEGELAAIDDAQRSSSAMSKLMEDMVTVLASTPEGQTALEDANVSRKDIIRIYKDIKRSTDQPISNENLIRWASYVISRNAEVRDALWAAQLARNSGIRAQMGPYEKKFLADLESDPLKTIRRELREVKKRTSDYERARFAYLTLNKEVMRELSQLQSALEAKEIAENILGDENWKAYRKEVYTDAHVEGTQKPFQSFTDRILVLPNGTEVTIDPEHMRGSKTQFENVYASYKRAEESLENWLNDPKNIDDPNWSIHRRSLNELQDYITSLSMLAPADADRVFGYSMTVLRDAIELAGTRMRDAALKAMNAWARVKEKAGWWNQRWSSRLMDARRQAMKSHGLKWGSFQKDDQVSANQIWWENVGNILHYSHQRQQGGFKVGDQLPSGWTVTKEDLDQLKLQSEAISAGFDVIKDFQLTQDTLSKTGLFRKALKGSENMVRRIFNNGMLRWSEQYVSARKEFQDASRGRNPEAQAMAEEKMIRLLNQNWGKIGFALVWDRNADFATQTIFDGEKGAFDVIGRQMLENPNSISSFEDLIDRLVSMTDDLSEEDARKVVLVEWGRIINQWYQAAKEEGDGRMTLPVRGKEAKNATTRSRDQALAPYAFYEYGFKDSRSIATFAGALHSAPLDRLVSSMVAIEEDLQRQIDELGDEANRNKAIDKNTKARRNGQTFDKLKDLDHRLKEVRGVLREISSYDPDQDVDRNLHRMIGSLTGLLISSVATTARNFTSGTTYIGQVMNRISGGSIKNNLWGLLYSWGFGGRTLFLEVPKSALRGAGRSIVKIPESLRQLKKGNFRGAYSTFFRDFIEEVGENTYQRVKTIKEMIDGGLLNLPDMKQDFVNMVEGSFLYGGTIPDKPLSKKDKILQSPIAFLEGTLLAATKTFAPIAGDTALNAAVYKVLPHALRDVQERLVNLFQTWKRTNYRQFNFGDVRDPSNLLTPQEMFPGRKTAAQEKAFSDMKQSFSAAGISFDEAAARFFSQMNAGEQPKHFLTDDEFKAMARRVINDINRPSPEGSPLVFQKNTVWMNIIKPFFSWKTRALQLFLRGLSVPGQHISSRQAAWAASILLVLIPALVVNAFLQVPVEEADRAMKRILFNQEKATRQPWERDGLDSQMIGWAINSTIGLPFIDMAINGMVNDLPVRASLYPELVVLSKLKDVSRYAGGVLQTGDPTFRLPELISSFVPDTRAVFNRMESQSGRRESSNIIALMRRHGDTELLREVGEPIAGVNYNELSPYGPRLENAAMNGDLAAFRQIYNEAVATAKEMGRTESEKAVRQLFSHRNPYDRAFRAKLTEGQKKAFLAKLSDSDRARIAEMEQKFKAASDSIGASFNTFKGESGTASLGRGRSGRGGLASLTRGRRRSRGGRSLRLRRGTRNLRRRSRLSRA